MKHKSAMHIELLKIASNCDKNGFYKEADELVKIAYGPFAKTNDRIFPEKIINEFKKQYRVGLKARNISGEEFATIRDTHGTSWILHDNGTLDWLPKTHMSYMRICADKIYDKMKIDQDEHNELLDIIFRNGAYKAIHDIFEGGLRIYIERSSFNIDGFQVPTTLQLQTLRKMTQAIPDVKVSSYLNTSNPDLFINANRDYPEKYFDRLENLPEMNFMKQEKIQQLRQFRDQTDEKQPAPEQKSLTKEEVNHLLKNLSLKKETLASILSLAEYCESKEWHKETDQLIKLSQTGNFSTPKTINYQPTVVAKFLSAYKRGLQYTNKQPEEFQNLKLGRSFWTLHEDGTLDLLPINHRVYIKKIYEEIKPSLGGDDSDHFNRSLNVYPEYQIMHELFDGAVRIYVYNQNMVLTGYQAPTQAQTATIQKLIQILNTESLSADFSLHQREDLGFYGMPNEIGLNSIKKLNLNNDNEDVNRHLLIQKFRNQFYKDDFSEPMPQKPKQPLRKEQTEHIIKNLKPFEMKKEISAQNEI